MITIENSHAKKTFNWQHFTVRLINNRNFCLLQSWNGYFKNGISKITLNNEYQYSYIYFRSYSEVRLSMESTMLICVVINLLFV